MNRIEEACPFEAQTRAGRCMTCCSASQVPPCVAAYLSGKALQPASNVLPFEDRYVPRARKAA
jgi:hypothetical protein